MSTRERVLQRVRELRTQRMGCKFSHADYVKFEAEFNAFMEEYRKRWDELKRNA